MRSVVLVTAAFFTAAAIAVPPQPGPGVVWVNPETKTYHCFGSQYYGKTKVGEYMHEKAAQKAGDKPAGNKACS